jgi:hypothetical protein
LYQTESAMTQRFGVLVICSALLMGCFGDDESSSEPTPDAGGDATDAGEDMDLDAGDAAAIVDSAVADAALDAQVEIDAGPTDSGQPDTGIDAAVAAGFVSNIPAAALEGESDPSTGVKIISSNLVQSPSGAQYFQQWYAELENTGTDIVCLLNINISFQDASSLERVGFTAYIDARPYKTSSTLSTACMGPGEHAAMYSNGFGDALIDLNEIKTIAVTWNSLVRNDAIPHPLAPSVVSSAVAGNMWVAGSFQNDSGTIYNIGTTVFPRAASGLIIDQLKDFHLETFYLNDVWAFETASASQPFTEYMQFEDFIEGADPTP